MTARWPLGAHVYRGGEVPMRSEPDPAPVMTGEEYDALMLLKAADPAERERMRAEGGKYPTWLAEHLGLCPRCQKPNNDMDHRLCELCRAWGTEEDY